jgi:hypothetical protein
VYILCISTYLQTIRIVGYFAKTFTCHPRKAEWRDTQNKVSILNRRRHFKTYALDLFLTILYIFGHSWAAKSKIENESITKVKENHYRKFVSMQRRRRIFAAALFVFFVPVLSALHENPEKLYVIISAFYLTLSLVAGSI